MEQKSFTSKFSAETIYEIVAKLPNFLNQNCKIRFSHTPYENNFVIYLYDENTTFVAEIVFDDKGAKVVEKQSDDLKIDIEGLSNLWKEELVENFGYEYKNYLKSLTDEDENTL